jgi:hypothetical protein
MYHPHNLNLIHFAQMNIGNRSIKDEIGTFNECSCGTSYIGPPYAHMRH